MVSEQLTIKNFAGIKDATLDVGRMTVFIGPQATGKSVAAKLLYYFRTMLKQNLRLMIRGEGKEKLVAAQRTMFRSYFPPTTWPSSAWSVTYRLGSLRLEVGGHRKKAGTSLTMRTVRARERLQSMADAFQEEATQTVRFRHGRLASYLRDQLLDAWLSHRLQAGGKDADAAVNLLLLADHLFVPAGRSYFSALRESVFSLVSADTRLDPFLVEFGRYYESSRDALLAGEDEDSPEERLLLHIIKRLMGGRVEMDDEDDETPVIRTDDGRRVPVSVASSGQQELLPLAASLVDLLSLPSDAAYLLIEEPEAHLYPTAQRDLVHLMALADGFGQPDCLNQYVITTHSPYVLSALNNLMYGHQLASRSQEDREGVRGILGSDALVDPHIVRAYAFGDGGAQSIIDEDTGLIVAEMIDDVSDQLDREFDALLDLESPDGTS